MSNNIIKKLIQFSNFCMINDQTVSQRLNHGWELENHYIWEIKVVALAKHSLLDWDASTLCRLA